MLEIELIKEYLKNATDEQISVAIRIIKRKIAFLKSGLLNDADEETIKFFSEIRNISKYKHIPNLLEQYQSYLMDVIKSDFKEREDISITIKVNEILLDCLEKRDSDLGKQWAHTRRKQLIKSCYENLIIKKETIE